MSDGTRRTEYLRTLREMSERRVVDEAEALLTTAWIGHLDAARLEALGLIAAARTADASARAQLRAAERGRRPAAILHARQRVEELERLGVDELAIARSFLDRVEEYVKRACRTASERESRRREDMELLRRAWDVAYGPDPDDER